MTRKKGNKGIAKEKRIKLILDLIRENGLSAVNYEKLAEQHKVSVRTIKRYVKEIQEKHPRTDVDTLSFRLSDDYEKTIKECNKILSNPEIELRVRLEAMRTLDKLAGGYTKILESYGKKTKVADKLEVKDDRVTWEAFQETYEKIKDGKSDSGKSVKRA